MNLKEKRKLKKESRDNKVIKPKVTPNKYQLTPEVRRQIEDLYPTLPLLPYTIIRADGATVVQQIKYGKQVDHSMVSAEDKARFARANPFESIGKTRWVERGTIGRTINHKVNLIEAFQKYGQIGIGNYLKEVATYKAYLDGISKDPKQEAIETHKTLPE